MAGAQFQYAVLRVVPRVERGESLNAGVIVLSRPRRFLGARVSLDEARLKAIAPDADPATILPHLAAIERIAAGDPSAGPIASLSIAERFHWLTAPSSTVISRRRSTPGCATTRKASSTACSSGWCGSGPQAGTFPGSVGETAATSGACSFSRQWLPRMITRRIQPIGIGASHWAAR